MGILFFRRGHTVLVNFRDARAPMKLHSHIHGVVHEDLMQLCAADGKARSAREFRARRVVLVLKLDSAEGKAAFRRQLYSQLAQSSDALRQDTLSTGLVDGGRSSVQNGCRQSLPPRRDSRYDPGRPRSDYDDFSVLSHD